MCLATALVVLVRKRTLAPDV